MAPPRYWLDPQTFRIWGSEANVCWGWCVLQDLGCCCGKLVQLGTNVLGYALCKGVGPGSSLRTSRAG